MYWRYTVELQDKLRKFSSREEVSLFGCNSGEIVSRWRGSADYAEFRPRRARSMTKDKHKEIKCLGEEGAALIQIVDPHFQKIASSHSN